jgi:hypothetical protein
MRPNRPVAAALLLGALAGCAAPGLPLGPELLRPAGVFQGATGETEVALRAFVEAGADAVAEVAGARCTVTTLLYTLEATTPARLALPVFGPQSPGLDVACRAGDRAGAARVAPTVTWLRYPGAWGYGPGPAPWGYGGAWGGPWGWDGFGGPAYAVFGYPDVRVRLD